MSKEIIFVNLLVLILCFAAYPLDMRIHPEAFGHQSVAIVMAFVVLMFDFLTWQQWKHPRA